MWEWRGAGIWDLFPAGISDTCVPLDKGFSMIFHGKKTSFGMCWMGGKGSGTLGIPWRWNMGWKTGMEPPTGSVNSLPAPEFHPEIPKNLSQSLIIPWQGWDGISFPNSRGFPLQTERVEPKASSFRKKSGNSPPGNGFRERPGSQEPPSQKKLGKRGGFGALLIKNPGIWGI